MTQDDYTTPGLPPPPQISSTTLTLNPFLLTIHGLDELPSPDIPLVVLWLLHPRSRTRARMNDIASRVIHAYYNTSSSSSDTKSTTTPPTTTHGLIAVSFDMPNHGTRLIAPLANESWEKGNPHHALDMFSMIRTARTDLSSLMDLLPLYLPHHNHTILSHMGLGWSLGGHAIWQAYLLEPRLSTVVSVVGCPDYCNLMKGRALKSGLDQDEVFPAGLRKLCEEVDPMCLLSAWEEEAIKGEGEGQGKVERLKQKKLLLCSGAEDHLVPYKCGKDAIDKLKRLGVKFEDKVYEGVGHKFSKDMVTDAVDFLVRNAKAAGQQ